ncbi:MAG: discoidin domain-containing protein [Acidobacteria bacterium]|nr:discoidin domain-containing protein [Acidobacteriota bacterium]
MTLRRTGPWLLATALVALACSFSPPSKYVRGASAFEAGKGTVTVSYSSGSPANVFTPSIALGAGVDGHEAGQTARMLSPRNVRAMLAAGLKPLSYRLRTELGDEVWHWNPLGSWSDPRHRQGYWTSDSAAGRPISLSYGYRLPRRGNTSDQANDDGYSRLDDGDPGTFWKSNPYLDAHYTGEDDSLHPQWVVVDLGEPKPVDTVRILWGQPYAARYQVEYGTPPDSSSDEDKSFNPHDPGLWHAFPQGAGLKGTGGETSVRLSAAPLRVRYVRVLLLESSHTAPRTSRDVRDGLGYAVREVALGRAGDGGRFRDEVRHAAAHERQTVIYVSSTDPWHRAVDRDPRVEQPGLDRVFRSGLTGGLPALVPAGVLYDTPDNAAALVRYLSARRYQLAGLELGEEPDGQSISPEDYGALYAQWVKAVRPNAPALPLGGPSLATITPYLDSGKDFTEKEWLRRFVSYLDAHRMLGAFNFFSFEWYPFDEVCEPPAPQLLTAPALLADALNGLRPGILPAGTQLFLTEYGYSAYASAAEVGIEGALLNADTVGLFLTLGGDRAYLYGYEPNEVISEVPCTWGNNMLFGMDEKGLIKYRTAAYYGAVLLSKFWATPADAPLEVFPAASDVRDAAGAPLVTAYALRRPDGRWSLLLINKDPRRLWDVDVRISDARGGGVSTLRLPADLYQFSRAQYVWKSDRDESRPARELPPAHSLLPSGAGPTLRLPPYSISVVRE